MKIKVAIVENEIFHQNTLKEILLQWQNTTSIQLEIDSYKEVSTFEKIPLDYHHIVFLDIQLDDGNGIVLANTLRKAGYQGAIVFTTSYSEYAIDGYHVQALNYLIKPICYDQVAVCMQKVADSLKKEYYVCRMKNIITKIPFTKIIYFSSDKHFINIVTTQATYKQSTSLNAIADMLPNEFHRCHRTAIVNITNILQLVGTDLTMCNHDRLPVSRTYLNDIQKAITNDVLS